MRSQVVYFYVFLSCLFISCQNNITSFIEISSVKDQQVIYTNTDFKIEGTRSSDITKIEVVIDGWGLGNATLSTLSNINTATFSKTIKINYAKSNRVLELIGYDSAGNVLAKKDLTIHTMEEPQLSLKGVGTVLYLKSGQHKTVAGLSTGPVDEIKIYIDGKWHSNADLLAQGGFEFDLYFDEDQSTHELVLQSIDEEGLMLKKSIYKIKVSQEENDKIYFNEYIMKAIDYLDLKYRLLGYDINSVLTHDIEYLDQGVIKRTNGALTMCVGAVLETILTAYDLYYQETGDDAPYRYLPMRSYQYLKQTDLKGHIWVNKDFDSFGTADALYNFGMGIRLKFSELKSGDFININRTTKTGHAVVFISYINKLGQELPEYDDSVIGFKYYSAQGRKAQGEGGFDYRYAIFGKYGCPEMPYKRDCNIIYSDNRVFLNLGRMLMPNLWDRNKAQKMMTDFSKNREQTIFDGDYFNGLTIDD